ncbi:MAG: glycosyltransferase family 2 protein [Deltaproteobacteria bacterium]|jgi:dolichyl-phosphate beta-glucosyltransferase|nr:glycosyltransferase family 2 protein [Deltaproteobacteria bacterium]
MGTSSNPSNSFSANSNPAISIVVPAYNEERRLPATIKDLRSFFGRFGSVEIIIVIEKSSDRTVELAAQAAAGDSSIQIIANEVQRGKGYAVKTGMLRAKGEVVFFMDADLSTPLAEVISFLSEFQANPGIDILIGSRAEAKSQVIKKQSWVRRNLGRGFNRFVQIFGVAGIKDTQCGFKAFRRRAVEPIFSRQTLNGFAFDVELLILAQLMGFKIQTVPVRWVNSPDSKVRIWIDPIKMFFDLVRIKRLARRTLKAKPYAAELPMSSKSAI